MLGNLGWRQVRKFRASPGAESAYQVWAKAGPAGEVIAIGIVWSSSTGLWHFTTNPEPNQPPATSAVGGFSSRRRAGEALLHYTRKGNPQ